MNNCMFMGNLTRDVELKPVGETHVAKFTIAISRKFKRKDGTEAKEVAFLDCEAWGSGAESISKYFTKGRKILIQASVKQDNWEDPEGKKRSKLLFRVEQFWFCDSKPVDTDVSTHTENESKAPRTKTVESAKADETDIPF